MKDIPGYEGLYAVTDDGRLWTYPKRWRITSPKSSHFIERSGYFFSCNERQRGYVSVRLTADGRTRRYPLHRLIAKAFLPNPNNLPVVNHLNGVKTDNRVSNLEWCTYSQ